MDFKNLEKKPINRIVVSLLGIVLSVVFALFFNTIYTHEWITIFALIVGLIAIPVLIKITEWLRYMTMPEMVIINGFQDILVKKFFWSYGIFIASFFASYVVIFFTIAVIFVNPQSENTVEQQPSKTVAK